MHPMSRNERRRAALGGARLRSLALSTVLVASATVLGLGAAGGTYALLSASASTSNVTITAGSFGLRIGGESPSATVTLADPTARAFTVTSVGERIDSNLSVQVAATNSAAIIANTEMRITAVESAAACVPGRSGIAQPFAALAGYSVPSLGELGAEQTRTFCLEVRLKPQTPVSQSGQSVDFTITVSGTQRAG